MLTKGNVDHKTHGSTTGKCERLRLRISRFGDEKPGIRQPVSGASPYRQRNHETRALAELAVITSIRPPMSLEWSLGQESPRPVP